jgi:hypothetical protein
MDITLDDTYKGPFELLGEDQGEQVFGSVQKAATIDTTNIHLLDLGVKPTTSRQNDFEVNTVNWRVNSFGKITGTARFLAVATHDLVKATLLGQTDPPVPGQDFIVARVDVTFEGGTGIYSSATGAASVISKLYTNGLSVGHIVGTVTIPLALEIPG